MSSARKIMVGALATLCVAGSWHVAMAQSFVDGLAAAAAAKVAAAPGVRVSIETAPLYRDVILSGPVSDNRQREQLLADVAGIPGVSTVRWSYDADTGAEAR